jgi:signal peptidase I
MGSMRIGGQGMMPTLISGDILLYRNHVFREDLHPDHLVFFRTSADSAWGNGGDLVVARILATPGDELSVLGGHFLVNGKRALPASPLGKFRSSLEIPPPPKSLRVPPGCYFVVQDDPKNSFDSRVLSWAREPKLVATRAIVLTGHAFGKEVE